MDKRWPKVIVFYYDNLPKGYYYCLGCPNTLLLVKIIFRSKQYRRYFQFQLNSITQPNLNQPLCHEILNCFQHT